MMLAILTTAAILLLLILLGLWSWYLSHWNRPGEWQEATRHSHRLYMLIERYIRFRWIHRDCNYWIFPVRFDRGAVVVRGQPNDALYWSLTYYALTEVNTSVSSASVVCGSDGQYEITLAHNAQGPNTITVRQGAKRAVLYLRIYEPAALFPTHLPAVTQNGIVLTEAHTQ